MIEKSAGWLACLLAVMAGWLIASALSLMPMVLAMTMPTPSTMPMAILTPTRAGTLTGSVILAVVPQTTTAAVGETFEVAIQVQAGTQQVDGAAAYLNFDPSVLQVVRVIPGDALDLVLQNAFRNDVGELDFAAGTLSEPKPAGTFTVVTVTFTAVANPSRTLLALNDMVPRQSDVTFGGQSVLDHAENGVVVGSLYEIYLPLMRR